MERPDDLKNTMLDIVGLSKDQAKRIPEKNLEYWKNKCRDLEERIEAHEGVLEELRGLKLVNLCTDCGRYHTEGSCEWCAESRHLMLEDQAMKHRER